MARSKIPLPVPLPLPPPEEAPGAETPPATAVRLDRLTPERRSWNMSRIRSADTKPERVVRQLITAMGLRYRLQRKDLPGKPDLVFGPRRTVIFVHGCFWHQHPGGCKAARMPKGNREFWQTKLNRNSARDAETRRALRRLGWRVLTIWECETKQPEKLQRRLARLLPPLLG